LHHKSDCQKEHRHCPVSFASTLTTVEQEDGVQALSETTIVGLLSDATYPHGANGST
jgi:hypothetical protein